MGATKPPSRCAAQLLRRPAMPEKASRKRRASSAEEPAPKKSKNRRSSDGEKSAYVPLEAETSAVGTAGWRNDSTELWLIKLPPGVEAADLDGKKCELGVGNSASSKSTVKLGDGRVFGLTTGAADVKSQYLSSFVCNAEKRWVVGKPFTREVSVVERFQFGTETDKCPKINVPVPMHVLSAQVDRGSRVGARPNLVGATEMAKGRASSLEAAPARPKTRRSSSAGGKKAAAKPKKEKNKKKKSK